MNAKLQELKDDLLEEQIRFATMTDDIEEHKTKLIAQQAKFGDASYRRDCSVIDDRESGKGESKKTISLIKETENESKNLKKITTEHDKKVAQRKAVSEKITDIESALIHPLQLETLYAEVGVSNFDEMLAYVRATKSSVSQ